jgi:hypothetical protein
MNTKQFFQAILFAAVTFNCVGAAASSYNFVKIADSQTAAPVGTFSNFGAPSISGNNVAFDGYYDGSNASGIFASIGGGLNTISKKGDAAPSGTFSQFFGTAIAGTSVGFVGIYNNSAGSGAFTGSGGPVTVIAKSGDAVPGGTIATISDVATDGANVAFSAVYNGATQGGIFLTSGGTSTLITSTTELPIGVSLSGSNVSFSSIGDVSRVGIGQSTTIAKFGDPAPIGTFLHFDSYPSLGPAIDGNNVAFVGYYAFGGIGGAFFGNGGPLTTIMTPGDPAPIGTFAGASSPSISGNNVAFVGWYDIFGSKPGIFIGNGGPLVSVIKAGDTLFGQTVTSVGIGTSSLDRGGSSNIAFRYTLSNGVTGVAIAHAVPEPSACYLLFLGTAGIWLVQCRRTS